MSEVIVDDVQVRIDDARKSRHEIIKQYVIAANQQVSYKKI